MIRVRTLQAHRNHYGAASVKAVGDEYAAPERGVGSLIALGLVEAVDEALAPKPARRGRRKRL
jgi:hypothetical protein